MKQTRCAEGYDHGWDNDERRGEGGEGNSCRFIVVSLVSYRMYFFILFQVLPTSFRGHHAIETPK